MNDSIVGWVQSVLARSRHAVLFSVKLQNQCRTIIARAHGATVRNPNKNGELLILRHLSSQMRNVVDVGGNKGDWTSLALGLAPCENVLVFEPSLSALQLLNERFGSDYRISIFPAALGEQRCSMSFFEEVGAGETSSLVTGASQGGGLSRMVQVTTLDHEIDLRGWPMVDFVKIDAEGYDFNVLKGASGLLREKRIRFGQFEYGDGWRMSGSTLTHAVEWLKGLGYACFVMRKDGLRHPRPTTYGEYFGYSNFMFCRNSDMSYVETILRGSI
jgi:FkbM family methyltransferase